METSFLKNNFTKIQSKAPKIMLPLALDLPIDEKALQENEIVMPFENIKSKGDAIIYCFQQMDVEMLSDLLDDDLTYEDKSKMHFIKGIKLKFQAFTEAGDTYLQCFKGRCDGKSCHNKNTLVGFDFVGNKSKKRFTFIVDLEQGKIINLFECIAYKKIEINLKEFFKKK
jgi:hypothetical protein